MLFHSPISRRRALGTLAGSAALTAAPLLAQPNKASGVLKPITVMQVADMSASQIDVAKDFLVGSRAAWQDINARGGLHGRPVVHKVAEVDGSAASLNLAIDVLKTQQQVVAMFGTVGDGVATELSGLLARHVPDIAHIAPWLHTPGREAGDTTFPVFARMQDQIAYAIKSLATMSVKEIGVVYTNPAEVAAYRRSVEQIGTALQLRVTAYGPSNDLRQLAQSLSPQSPRVLIFLGGTPELYQFTQGVDKQASQRYVVAMSDVNLQTLSQLGVSRHASVIATQVVPMVSANQAITMAYRECLARLYDEAPSPQGLAGFIAARYTFETMQRLNGPPTRQSVMQAMQKRSSFDLGGFHIRVDASRSTGTYVTQTMLGTNGRVVG